MQIKEILLGAIKDQKRISSGFTDNQIKSQQGDEEMKSDKITDNNGYTKYKKTYTESIITRSAQRDKIEIW